MKKKIAVVLAAGLILTSSAALANTPYKSIKVIFQRLTLEVNGETMPMNKDVLTYNGSVYVPLRDLTNLLGAEVQYNGASRSVAIDFVHDDLITGVDRASKFGLYQYLVMSHNQCLKDMIKDFKANDMEAMETVVEKYEELKTIADQMQDTQLADTFAKLQLSVELMRSGYASKKLDDYYLAWTIFETHARSANETLRSNLAANNGAGN